MELSSEAKTSSRVFIDQDGWYYEEYQLEGDPWHLVRIRQRGPLCSGTEVERDVHVAGISHQPCLGNAHRFCHGTYRWLDLEWHPLERHPHAIAVFGRWYEDGAEQRAQLGWVPDRVAKRLHSTIPEGALRARLFVIFLPRGDRSPGMRFDLLHAKRQESSA